MDSHALAIHSAPAARPTWPRLWPGPSPLAQCLLSEARTVLVIRGLCFSSPILFEVNYQLESRMRENRLSGSEGGGAYALPTPIPAGEPGSPARAVFARWGG